MTADNQPEVTPWPPEQQAKITEIYQIRAILDEAIRRVIALDETCYNAHNGTALGRDSANEIHQELSMASHLLYLEVYGLVQVPRDCLHTKLYIGPDGWRVLPLDGK